jgi:excisionase family DNA binding protein
VATPNLALWARTPEEEAGRVSDLSPLEVASELGLSRSAVYRLIEQGELVAYKVRGRLRVEPAEVRALRERCRVAPRRRDAWAVFEPVLPGRVEAGSRFGSDLRSTRGVA